MAKKIKCTEREWIFKDCKFNEGNFCKKWNVTLEEGKTMCNTCASYKKVK